MDKTNKNDSTSNQKHAEAVDFVIQELKQKSLEKSLNAKIEHASKSDCDVIVTYNNNETPLKIGVIRMKENAKGTPYSAVSLTKWIAATSSSSNYCFAIVCENQEGQFECSYYSVEEFWNLTSQPLFHLYCHRNQGPFHDANYLKDPNIHHNPNMKKIQKCISALKQCKKEFAELKK